MGKACAPPRRRVHRAASGILPHPLARRLNRRGPGCETAVGAPTHRSRIARRLFHPWLRLRPRFLAGEEGSTPWTRPPFTSRPPRGEPGRWTGGEASMRPTVIAYRLLQPVKERRTSTTSGFDLRSVTRAATLFTFCGRGDSPLARDEADGPRTTCSGGTTPSPLFPVRAWRTRYELRYHPPRRRLATPATGGPGSVGRGTERRTRAPWMLREFPSSASLVHPIVTGALSARPGEPSRPNAATDRDPRIAALPRRRTTDWGPGCFPLPTIRRVHIDRSM